MEKLFSFAAYLKQHTLLRTKTLLEIRGQMVELCGI